MRLPILCYHKVGPESEEGRRLNVSPERLRDHVRYFKRRGRAFVTAGSLASSWPSRGVCLTFDDAYLSAVVHGLPVLREEGVVATLYAVTAHVGGASGWDGEAARPLADWPALVEAAQAGFEIGNHTAHHLRMSEASGEVCAQELQEASEALAAHGLQVRSFCYPYGAWTATARNAVAATGCPVALSLGKRVATRSDDRLALPRLVVSYSDALPKLLYKLWLRPLLPM